ncbi:cytochrome c-type biogenesis protein CcmH [Oceanospirillaceae bacterium]|nr:cytochrome c-type biogenesis protein CcmH [Oceanospirillaceae bacterium]
MIQAINVNKTNAKGLVTKFRGCVRLWVILMVGSLMTAKGYAAIDTFEFASEKQQQIFVRLTEELRCPKCQNNNLVGSGAGIAEDMRVQIYKMVGEGKGYDEISDYMVARYGEFVRYRPTLSPLTWVLWFGPWIFLSLGALLLFWLSRRRS